MRLSTIAARATAALCVILTYVLGAAMGMVEGGGTCGVVCVCGVYVCVCMCEYVCVVLCGVWSVVCGVCYFLYKKCHKML